MNERYKLNEKIKCTLEYVLESLRRPTYNSLETGFRHTPLSQKEILERYEETFIIAAMAIEELLKDLYKIGDTEDDGKIS